MPFGLDDVRFPVRPSGFALDDINFPVATTTPTRVIALTGRDDTSIALSGGSAVPVVKNVSCYRGESLAFSDSIQDAAGAAEDVAGWTFAFTVRRGYVDQDGNLIRSASNVVGWSLTGDDPDVLVQKSSGSGIVTTSASGGIITITVDAADTLLLPVGDCAYDVWRTDPGAEACLTIGNLRVRPPVRR